MTTSDERREVARKLREMGSSADNSLDYDDVCQRVDEIIGTVECGSWKVFFDRLADLIDPTCHMVDTDHEYEDSIRCDVCQMTFNRPWEPFNYCPNCGRKVVNDR